MARLGRDDAADIFAGHCAAVASTRAAVGRHTRPPQLVVCRVRLLVRAGAKGLFWACVRDVRTVYASRRQRLAARTWGKVITRIYGRARGHRVCCFMCTACMLVYYSRLMPLRCLLSCGCCTLRGGRTRCAPVLKTSRMLGKGVAPMRERARSIGVRAKVCSTCVLVASWPCSGRAHLCSC